MTTFFLFQKRLQFIFLYAVIISIMWIVVIDVIDRGCYVMADAVIELISYYRLTESWQIT